MPVTRIEALDRAPLDAAMAQIGAYQHLIVTSQNAVGFIWDALRAAGRDARALAGLTVSVIGPSTGEVLLARGIAADVVPDRFVAEGVLDALQSRGGVRGARVLYPTALGARDVLPDGLRAMGATVDVIPVYRSVIDRDGSEGIQRAVEMGDVDLVTFTSASSVHGYIDCVGAGLAGRVRAASIGPITSETARAAGIEVAIEAGESTIAGLVEAIVGGG
jgi:uroporphyrinogen III methyltransferase/synthase